MMKECLSSSAHFHTIAITEITVCRMNTVLKNRPNPSHIVIWHCAIRYDTRCYFNVQSKADTSQLNLPHGTNNYNAENIKSKKKLKQTDMLRSIGKQSGESVESVLKKKRK